MDARLNRPAQTLIINGFWLESWFNPGETFAAAFAKGLVRFADFLGAKHLDSSGIDARILRNEIDRNFPI
jgi:uncharacterized protein YcaQ